VPAIRLDVYIQPRASKSEVAGLHGGIIKIRIAAPAVENAANLALMEFVAETLGIAKRSVRIVSGIASRRKVLEIEGVTDEQIAAKLSPPLDLNPTRS
jgi:uncharacterized protein (TIGR00251 family)